MLCLHVHVLDFDWNTTTTRTFFSTVKGLAWFYVTIPQTDLVANGFGIAAAKLILLFLHDRVAVTMPRNL